MKRLTITIDLRTSWSEFGRMYARFAESGEQAALVELRADLALAMAAAQALQELGSSLTPEQAAMRDQIIRRELAVESGRMGTTH